MHERLLPIIYVRGYAGTQDEVEQTTDDPFYGFNVGSTHARIGPKLIPTKFVFESPLVRLMTDYGYVDAYHRGVESIEGLEAERRPRTIWIHRYYDVTAGTFDDSASNRLLIEEAADDLMEKIDQVRSITGAPRVYLVAHSMGGLICRCLLQQRYPSQGRDAHEFVDKLFTYATPHGGISFERLGRLLGWFRDRGVNDSDNFSPERMKEFLLPPGASPDDPSFDPQESMGYSPTRIFSLVGTNSKDYLVFKGAVANVVGPDSDGLVKIRHAYVRGSNRAYVHRSHSGRYGIVNSEEGYRNLERFLFGDVRVEMILDGVSLPPGPHVLDSSSYQAECAVSILGLPTKIHEQTQEHMCPIDLDRDRRTHHLFTVFLRRPTGRFWEDASFEDFRIPREYAMYLAVHRIDVTREGLFRTRLHLEGVPLFNDFLRVELMPVREDVGIRFQPLVAWNSERQLATRCVFRELSTHEPMPWDSSAGGRPQAGIREGHVPLPSLGRSLLGEAARITIRTHPWNDWHEEAAPIGSVAQ